MSNETIHDAEQGWPSEPASTTSQNTGANQGAPVAFCQDCGRALTPETIRTVGTGVFCEPCLANRMGVPVNAAYPGTPLGHEPSPAIATLVGLVPGAGAMYNGQYAKGFAHLVVFAVLISLSNHVSEIFGLFCFAWYCYMVFDAYHTAKARLLGLPLPNAFGFNEIGERMGFGKNWPYPQTGNVPPVGYTAPATPPAYAPPPTYAAPTAGPNWVGYVPPTEFGAAAAAERFRAETEAAAYRAASVIRDQAVRDTGYSTPYTQTYAGPASEHAVPTVAPFVPAVSATPSRRLPVAAFILIGLGALILLGTLIPEWSINGRWFLPVIFFALSLIVLQRRIRSGARWACVVRWPVILMVLAIMSGLHAAYFDITFGMTCAVLLIVIGALLLLERTIGASPAYVVAPPVTDDAGRASFTSAGPVAPVVSETIVTDETEKGGL